MKEADGIDHDLLEKKGWFRPRAVMSQADGDDGSPRTSYEPYPQMSSVEKEELLILLKAKVAALDKRVAELEKK